jgi:hypothetical protein
MVGRRDNLVAPMGRRDHHTILPESDNDLVAVSVQAQVTQSVKTLLEGHTPPWIYAARCRFAVRTTSLASANRAGGSWLFRGGVVVSDLRRTAGKLELHVVDAFGQRRVAVALKL